MNCKGLLYLFVELLPKSALFLVHLTSSYKVVGGFICLSFLRPFICFSEAENQKDGHPRPDQSPSNEENEESGEW